MTILRLDDLVGCGAAVLMLAGPAQFLARHRLH
jgi:hypothetical protein